MLASRRSGPTAGSGVSLRETLIAAGLEPRSSRRLDRMPHKVVHVDPRRPFREPGVPRDEVIFVRSGLISKFKVDSSGGGRLSRFGFPAKAFCPVQGDASYGIQAIVPQRSHGWLRRMTSTRSSISIRNCTSSSGISRSATKRSATNGWSTAAAAIQPPEWPTCFARLPFGATSTYLKSPFTIPSRNNRLPTSPGKPRSTSTA